MADLVVTVPKGFWFDWIAEGDAAGQPPSGTEWGFWLGTRRPGIVAGERLYIVAWGRLRGYSPVTRVTQDDAGRWVICRRGGGIAVTIDEPVKGFQGFRNRWWGLDAERPFPDWMTADIPDKERERAIRRGVFQEVRLVRSGWTKMLNAPIESYRYEHGGSIWWREDEGKWAWHLDKLQPYLGLEDTPEEAAERVELIKKPRSGQSTAGGDGTITVW